METGEIEARYGSADVRFKGQGMALPERNVFTVDQIATRWRVDSDYVRATVQRRSLPQAFVVLGPARILMPAAAGGFLPHPQTRARPFRTSVTVSTLHSMPTLTRWPLKAVVRVFDYSGATEPAGPSLLQFRRFDKLFQTGWVLDFDPAETTIDGRDAILVALEDLKRFEQANAIDPSGRPKHLEPRHPRDTRMQRCRVIAELLWRRDPTATLVDIYRHEWIQKVACAGQPPAENTFREWVKDLNPNRSPGRRPKL